MGPQKRHICMVQSLSGFYVGYSSRMDIYMGNVQAYKGLRSNYARLLCAVTSTKMLRREFDGG